MVIYRVIDLFHIPDEGSLSFIIAFAFVYILAYLLNKMMPQTIAYERVTATAGLLEEVYQGNVTAFRRRLSRQAIVETVSAIYFGVTILVLIWVIFVTGQYDIFALIIFAFLAVGAIGQSARLIKANSTLSANPTGEQCAAIVMETYKLDYPGFYEAHQGRTINEMLPERPRYFNIFLVFSLVVAVATTLFGLFYIVSSVITFVVNSDYASAGVAVALAMYFLYGSLATYFGIRDIISTVAGLKRSRESK